MSLVVPGLGRTITFKPRRPSPKAKVSRRGKVTANPYVTDKKPKPKLGSKPRGGKVTPVRGTVNDKPRPKSGGRAIPRPSRPAAAGAANRPKQPVRAPRNRRIAASGKRFGGRPMSSASKPKQPSRASSNRRGTTSAKRYGYGKRPMSLLSRRPRGRR